MNKHCCGKLPIYLLAFLFFLTTSTTIGQGFYNTTNWRFSNPKQFGFGLIDLDFADNNRGIAVGANGGIAYTTDGGAKWSYGAFTFISPAGILTSTTFQDVQFINTTTAHAVGTNGCMAKTTDGGATWNFIRTPLFNNSKSINTVWFLDANKGYIAGQHNSTPDLTPKLYVTNNGGATWDSMAAPVGGKTRVGYANNVNLAPLVWDITAKEKEIWRIIFVNANLGYISGSGLGTFESFPAAAATGTCLPTGGTTTTGSHHASLLWKFSNGILIDYSISKERLGFNGVYTNLPAACNYRIASNGVHTQQYKAMNIVDDTTVLLVSSNNNIVIKVSTGPNSFTPNIGVPGVTEIGTYKLLNAPFPPINNSATQGAQIPASGASFSFLNPINIVKAANGKLFTPVLSGNFGPVNRLMTTIDTGKTWVEERFLPTGRNYSDFGGQAVDILPSGKMVFGGTNGVTSEILPGGSPTSTYVQYALGSFNKMDFADCNNIIAAGGGFITRTNDGGKTWDEIIRADFNNLNIQINSVAYVPNNPAKAYFATSIGSIYKSNDINIVTPAPTLDPVFANSNEQIVDLATVGNDSVWACGQSGFSVAAASRSPKVFRSTNGGTTWTTFNGFNVGTLAQTFRNIEFPTRLVGYVSGSRDTVWKTTDGGVTWNKLPVPTPGVTPQITYTDMFALDANTVFLVGNGFPRKVVFKSTDGGNSWQEITGNILAIMPVSNLNSVVFHDANNGYVGANGAILVTNNGGASWSLDVQPSGNNNVTIGFAPKKVPAGTPFVNRRLFTAGVFGNHIMEYGDTTKLNVSSAEGITASCTNTSNGAVVVNATGGIAPYTYSIDGGQFQASNTFNNISGGNHTITIKDAFCGIVTKTVVVPTRAAPQVDAGLDKIIVEGDNVMLQGSSLSSLATIAWTPSSSIISGGSTFTPVVKPPVTTNYTLTATGVNGCISSDVTTVTVIPYCIKLMNAFTPNGDGMNDRWLVTTSAVCTKQIAVAVFNRYGNIVYKNDNYQNNWEGTYNGKPVPDGTYYYTVTYTTITNNTILMKGDLTILR